MTKELEKLERARIAAITVGEGSGRIAGSLLRYAIGADEIEGFGSKARALAFPGLKSGAPSCVMGFMVDWIKNHTDEELIEQLLELVEESIADGDLPGSPDEFVDDTAEEPPLLQKLDRARKGAVIEGERQNRRAGSILKYATAYDGVDGFDDNIMALVFPAQKSGEPPFMLGLMAEMVADLSDEGLVDRLLEIVERAIEDGDLPDDQAAFVVG